MISDLRRILPLLQLRIGRFVLAVLAGAAGLGSAIALSAVAGWLIARASQMPHVLSLTVAAVAVRTFGVSRPIMRYLERLASHQVALDGMASIREQTYRIISRGRVATLRHLRRGDLLARTSTDVEEVANVVVLSLLPAAVAAVVGIGVVIALAFFSPALALAVALAQLAAGLVGPYFTMRGAAIAERERRGAELDLGAEALVLAEDTTELRVSGAVPATLTRIGRAEADLTATSDRAAVPAALGSAFDMLSQLAAVFAVTVIGIQQVHTGVLVEVELAVVVLLTLAAFEATSRLGPAAVQLIRSATAATRILELLDAAHGAPVTQALPESLDPVPAPGSPQPATPHAVLELQDAQLAWPGHSPVAEHVSLRAEVGRSVAIVGPSGIGKTTLLATLAGYLPGGTLTLDGVPIAGPGETPEREALNGVVSLTEEDAHIFHASVLENLRVANGALTREEATELVGRAGLSDWLAALPEGLDTMLGADARTVSGGERRRLLLARALAAPAPLLLMDETAEHLDSDTADRLIGDLIDASSADRGLVLVTHRLTPLAGVDEVIVMGAGPGGVAHILDRGTHAELVARNEYYRWALRQEEGT
ncbi:MAG: thiol reductant ABC exporter subunit CydC [Bowdeniella nasicola]|nr:thiol reductant ABC exporter subunit CydC [Bowdeniella nasicola]